MCTISIDPNSISTAPATGGYVVLTVSGTIANCTSNNVGVTIACPGSSTGVHQGHVTGNSWTASGDVKCNCGDTVTIVATCNDPTPCSTTYTTQFLCNCCPTVHANANPGLWNSAGQQLVTFVTNLSFPAGCSVTVQRDFGDTSFGASHTFTTSPATYNETHAYNVGGYTSHLNILSNPVCGPTSTTATTSPGGAPPCATNSLWASACTVLQVLFLLSAAVAAVLFIASSSPLCSAVNPLLAPIATGLAISAGVFLLLLYLFCRKCVCGFFVKLFGQLFVIVGAVLFMFVLPTILPALINCAQPFPFLAPYAALGAAVIALLIGAAALLSGGWYVQYRTVCPLNICDYWQAVRTALILAVIAVTIVFIALAGGVPLVPHALFAVVIIFILLILVALEIIINQNAGNC
jgi:hypothetical protein